MMTSFYSNEMSLCITGRIPGLKVHFDVNMATQLFPDWYSHDASFLHFHFHPICIFKWEIVLL